MVSLLFLSMRQSAPDSLSYKDYGDPSHLPRLNVMERGSMTHSWQMYGLLEYYMSR